MLTPFRTLVFRSVCLGLLTITVLAVSLHRGAAMFAQTSPPAVASDAACLSDARISRNVRTGSIRFVGTRPGRAIRWSPSQQAPGSAMDVARAYMSACGWLFGVPDQEEELRLLRTSDSGAGRTVVRFQQQKSGLPVFAGEVVVELDSTRNIVAVVAKAATIPAIDATPTVSPTVATQAAVDAVAKAYGVADLTASTPELWVYDPRLLGPGSGPASLVWRMDVSGDRVSPIRELVLVDAHRGSVVLHFNQISFARNRATFTASNGFFLPGRLVCNETNPCTSPPEDAQVSAAHLYAGDTYDYYFNNFGRDSLDNAGIPIVSTVHYRDGYNNTFWNGTEAVFGDALGYPLADDIVAHELTHGFTQYTSGLFAYYQSGAISESISDVFGEFIDLSNGHGNDAPEVRWLIGEDIGGGGAIRSMQDPTAFSQPDKMTSSLYYTGDKDDGGIHTNGGINNKAAFLMSDGGTFNGHTVTGIGITKTAKLYYEANTHLLVSGSDYADLFDALDQACSNLMESGDLTSSDCAQVQAATLAVEMNLQPVDGFNTDAAFCSGGLLPQNIFFDDLENGAGNYAFSANPGTIRWTYDSTYAHSGSHALFANDSPGQITDTSAAMTSSYLLPDGAFLYFAHAYGFEIPDYDGGVIEYSVDGGANWTDGGSLIDTNGYGGTIRTGYGNPLAGRPGFIGVSHGYVSSRLNLASLSGQNICFRWRMGLDNSTAHEGWWVDDVRIYVCAAKKKGGQITSNGQ